MKKIRNSGNFYGNCPQCNKPRTDLNFCINCKRNYHIEILIGVDLIEYRDKGCFGEIHSAYWLSDPLSMWDRDFVI
nr:15883_t:CDS:2 [Entrophospora candida]